MTRALVTGGCGFVGRHLCAKLHEEGIDVLCVDNLLQGTGAIHPTAWPYPILSAAQRFVFLQQDCRRFFEKNFDSFDMVFHLAAIVGGRMTLENQSLLVAEDLSVDAQFWKWATLAKPERVVYFSSSAAYPIRFQEREFHTLLSEEMISFAMPLGMPDLSYGWSKLTGEYLMKLYVEKYGGLAVAYRPFSGYGEDQDLAYPFPAICNRLLGQKHAKEVFVWGTGHQARDFIHISDCIDFIWRTFAVLPNGTSLNLSTGTPTSFIQLAKLISNEIGWMPFITGLSDKPEGVYFRCGDTKLQSAYGLKPKVDLAEGARRFLEYSGGVASSLSVRD